MDGAVSSVADVVRGMLPWSSTPKTRPSRTLSRTPNFNFKDHLLRPDSVETLVLSPSRLPPDDTEDLNPLEDESTTQQKSLLSRCLGGWFITAAVASTLVSIPVTLACLPFALAALAPAALFLLGSLLALRITFILFGREGLVWAGFRFVLNTGIDVVRYTATVLLQKLSGQQPMPTIDVSSSSGSTLMDHHAEGAHYGQRPQHSPLLHHKPSLDRAFHAQYPHRSNSFASFPPLDPVAERGGGPSSHVPPMADSADLARYLAYSASGSRLSLVSTHTATETSALVKEYEYAFKLLDPEVDAQRIHACSLLYTSSVRSPVPLQVLLGQHSSEGKMVHQILSLWWTGGGVIGEEEDHTMKPDDVPHGQDPSATLIGFVEFFHKASDPTRIFIDKLIMNTHYEGLGFSRRLVRELQALPNLASVEVWSLWKSESFYKALGFVDVISVTSDPAHVAETRRVVRPYGPLLTWYPSG